MYTPIQCEVKIMPGSRASGAAGWPVDGTVRGHSPLRNWLAGIVCGLMLMVAGQVFAAECKVEIKLDQWIRLAGETEAEQGAYFKDLQVCLKEHAEKRSVNDTLAVYLLMNLDEMPVKAQKPMVGVIRQGLLAGAKAGYPSSQHNYASLFNARPGSTLAALVPQDYTVFMHWTQVAASNHELRAIFNLAMRLPEGQPEAGVKADPETAYILLKTLEDATKDEATDAAMSGVRPIVVEAMDKLKAQLGTEKTDALDTRVAGYDFKKLAPAGKLTGDE